MRCLLCWFCLLNILFNTEAAFTFILRINGHSTSGTCDTFVNPDCETYFSLFCLRGFRTDKSTDISDCPLGAYRGRFTQQSGSISIQSSAEWEGRFQLFIQAFDDDDFVSSDHLDDIFVEGSSSNGALSSAMTFSGGRVSVTVQFQRTCDHNYYNVSCLTRCVPADNDADGHFTCNVIDGSKVCLPGYSNPENNCRDNINDCSSEPCHNGGTCTDLVADFACTCPPGYTGETCSLKVDQCKDTVCPGNSTYVDSTNSFTCVCNPGYTGDNCKEVLNPCESGPCGTSGLCIVLNPSNFTCVCLAGYTGPQCEVNIDECLKADCPPGTTCKDGINSFQCLQQPREDQISGGSRSSNGLVIGVVVAVVIILVFGILMFCMVLLVLKLRKKTKKFDHEHCGSDDKSSKLDHEKYENGKAENFIPTGYKNSLTESLHVCDNSLYHLPENTAIQERIGEEAQFEATEAVIGDKNKYEGYYERIDDGHFNCKQPLPPLPATNGFHAPLSPDKNCLHDQTPNNAANGVIYHQLLPSAAD